MTVNINPLPPPEHLTHPKYRPDIDGLRAMAVLSVVVFHAFPKYLRGGFIGVDIFFVISGFLISTIIMGSLERNSFSFIEFYSRRIKRIFPSLILVLVASFVFGWFVLLPEEYKQLGKHIAGGAGFFSNFLFLNESGYFDNAADTKPLLHLWSLGIEEQFYVVWPLLLWFAWKKKFNLLTITIVIGITTFLLNISKVHDDATAAFFSPQTRFWELLLGAVLAYMTLHRKSLFPKLKHKLDMWLGQIIYAKAPENNGKTLQNVQSVLGAFLILTGLLVITKERHFPGWWAVLPTIGALLIISAGVHAWFNRVVLANRVLVWFGLISFPLYLWHWPLLSFARIIEGGMPSNEIRIAAILIAISLAWMTYKFIEKPMRFGKYSKEKTFVSLILMIVIGVVGYICYVNNGFSYRSNLIMSEDDIKKERLRYWRGIKLSNNYENGKLKVLIYGDSQAQDMYYVLKNEDAIGLKYFKSLHFCSAFFSADKNAEQLFNNDCKKYFDILINSKELIKADVLIYSHYWLNGNEEESNYKIGLENILKVNPKLKVVFVGPKPIIGNSWISINAITRNHKTQIGLNNYLNSIKNMRLDDDRYAKNISRNLGLDYISVSEIFCKNDICPFFVDNKFTYFDQNHWTLYGTHLFYLNLKDKMMLQNILNVS